MLAWRWPWEVETCSYIDIIKNFVVFDGHLFIQSLNADYTKLILNHALIMYFCYVCWVCQERLLSYKTILVVFK